MFFKISGTTPAGTIEGQRDSAAEALHVVREYQSKGMEVVIRDANGNDVTVNHLVQLAGASNGEVNNG